MGRSTSRSERQAIIRRLTQKAIAMSKGGMSNNKIAEEMRLDILNTGACWHTRRDYFNVVMANLQLEKLTN
jgi:orotate phosphoribosyltransferase-like protein